MELGFLQKVTKATKRKSPFVSLSSVQDQFLVGADVRRLAPKPASVLFLRLLRLFAAISTYLSGKSRNPVADIFRLGILCALAVQIRPRLSPLLDLCSGWAGLPLRLPTRGKFGLCKPFNACKMAGKMLDAKPRPR